MATDPWWRSAVIYQIYPRSFADSDGDGVGDLPGILGHLDHLSHLGVDAVWLSPIYLSPMVDMGYDVADYRAIDPRFGTEADFDRLVAALHERGIRLIMDVVFNHTSAEHPWFAASRSSVTDPRRDWYVWRDPRPGTTPGLPGAEPTNWESFFGGPAWTFDDATGQYYLHLFASEQPDLNWDEPQVREAVADVLRYWLGRGVDGFRMDVINLISKDQSFPDGEPGPNGFGDGYPFYGNGPRVHEFLRELRRAVGPEVLLIAETPGASPADGERYTSPARKEVDMLFQFEHVGLDTDGTKWDPREVTVGDIVDNLERWQVGMGTGWNALYWSNHDQPRIASRFGDPDFRRESATALATLLHLQRGTPFVYQGEEIGTTNYPFTDPGQFRDVESVNAFADLLARGITSEDALARVARMSRDNARIPMAWNDGEGGGFSSGDPWLPVHPDFRRTNVAAQRADETSVLAYYRRLIALRHAHAVVASGDLTVHPPVDDAVVWFTRTLRHQTLDVYVNLGRTTHHLPSAGRGTVLLANQQLHGDWLTLGAWQAVVIQRTD